MRLRIPLFMKKRGARRTGARWLGPLGEAVLFAVFALGGALGLASLVSGALAPQWPWLVAIIPTSVFIYGVAGLVGLLWHSSTSTELRSAVAQKASEVEQRLAAGDTGAQLPAVPSIASVVDSPGVRLAHRLPIDASPNWLLVGMTVICVCWNLLVGLFVVQVIELHATGRPNWLLTWLVVPFAFAGVWTLGALARELWMTTGLGLTRVEVERIPLTAGESARVFLSQSGRVNVRWLKVLLVCEERATYPQGTDTRTEVQRVFQRTVFRRRKFDIQRDAPFEADLDITVPKGAMHSFISPHNRVEWLLVVRGRVARWPIFERSFPLYVFPQTTAIVSPRVPRQGAIA